MRLFQFSIGDAAKYVVDATALKLAWFQFSIGDANTALHTPPRHYSRPGFNSLLEMRQAGLTYFGSNSCIGVFQFSIGDASQL